MKVIKIEDEYALLMMLINLAILLKLPSKYNLREREKEFLANCALYSSKGITLESTEMVSQLCKVMNMKPSDIYTYRNKLKNKGWFIQTTSGLDLLPALDFNNKKIPKYIKLQYKLEIE